MRLAKHWTLCTEAELEEYLAWDYTGWQQEYIPNGITPPQLSLLQDLTLSRLPGRRAEAQARLAVELKRLGKTRYQLTTREASDIISLILNRPKTRARG